MLEAYLRAEQFEPAEAMLCARLQRRASARDLFWLGRAQARSGQSEAARVSLQEVSQRWQDADPASPERMLLNHLASPTVSRHQQAKTAFTPLLCFRKNP